MSKSLGFWRTWALVVGTMIGSGVFLLPAVLAPYGSFSLIGWIVDRLETRIIVGQGAAITGALNVVLTAHRVDARSFTTDVAGHECQVAEAAC